MAHIHEPLHIFRAEAEFVLAHHLGEGRAEVVVHAGKNEGVVVGGATYARGKTVCRVVVKENDGEGLVRLGRGQLRGKAERGDVEAVLSRDRPPERYIGG